ncbi:hypothetical protein SAMN05421780_104259 [Flexibacter flexilis DSM 6793]|uniref:ABC-2 type transport system permease protein n=1 Tax=Flexibacter flexilis DSM 6793 TaxID=927664 RepID=A0A1I1I8E1_9BACT|nr:ABC transporter permease [Flexibacter flexilis]SFC32446.1 hypothetical protein SAMN05421780_104259 [Flexibacter flexilis DSM 6793]
MINRRLKDAVFVPLLAYLMLIVGFIVFSLYLFSKTEFAQYIYVFYALVLIGKLSEIRRTEFLKLCFGNVKLKKIRIIENIICSFPFLLFLLYKQFFLLAFILFISTIFLPFVNFRTTFNFVIWTPFSKQPFEFIIGFRNTFYLFFIAYILGIVAVYINNFNLGAFSILLVFLTTLSYYTKPENEYYVWIFNGNSRNFILQKIKISIFFSTLIVLPIIVILLIYYPQNVGIILLLLLIGWAFLISIIAAKYSAYPDEMNIPQGIFFALCIWFPPILILVIPYLFKKAENRLKYLLK